MITLTRKAVSDAMDAVVAEAGPDYIYSNIEHNSNYHPCYYVFDGQPSCLIGKILARLGVDMSWFAANDNRNEVNLNSVADRDDVPFKFEDNTTLISLVYAQSVQDGGGSWGRARDRYYVSLAADMMSNV